MSALIKVNSPILYTHLLFIFYIHILEDGQRTMSVLNVFLCAPIDRLTISEAFIRLKKPIFRFSRYLYAGERALIE